MSAPRSWILAALGSLLVLVSAGCTTLPESGAIHQSGCRVSGLVAVASTPVPSGDHTGAYELATPGNSSNGAPSPCGCATSLPALPVTSVLPSGENRAA